MTTLPSNINYRQRCQTGWVWHRHDPHYGNLTQIELIIAIDCMDISLSFHVDLFLFEKRNTSKLKMYFL